MSYVTHDPFIQVRLKPATDPPTPMSTRPPPAHSEPFSATHALTLILTIVLLVLFFIGFFSVYFCRCFMENLMSILHGRARNPIGTPVNPTNPDPPGLNPAIIKSFPAFDYSSVKDHRPALDCAICLSEFQDLDPLRLIPECCHVFHQDCIDLWLASHKSCPVCRRLLDPDPLPDPDGPGPDPGPDGPEGGIDPCGPGEEGSGSSCSITVKEESPFLVHTRFSRSHSTGHSIVAEKYTLRLPEHVMREKMARGHVQALSCMTFREMSHARRCFGEIQ